MNTNHGKRRSAADTRRVVVVLGDPDDTLIASLRAVGLAPVASDGEAVIWGPSAPAAVRPEATTGTEPARLLVTVADAALALGIGRSTVYELIGRGDLEVIHVGRSARVPTEALRLLVERLRADERPSGRERATG